MAVKSCIYRCYKDHLEDVLYSTSLPIHDIVIQYTCNWCSTRMSHRIRLSAAEQAAYAVGGLQAASPLIKARLKRAGRIDQPDVLGPWKVPP